MYKRQINFSATPKLSRGQHPDVEMTDEEAEQCKLIKTIVWGNESDTVRAVSYTHLDVYKRQVTALIYNFLRPTIGGIELELE